MNNNEKVRELLDRKPDVSDSVDSKIDFLKKLREVDPYGIYQYMYEEFLEVMINSIDIDTIDVLDLWNALNFTMQRTYYEIREKVLENIKTNPDRSIEVWNNTFEKTVFAYNPDITEIILEKAMEQDENEKNKLCTEVFNNVEISKLDIDLIKKVIELLSHKDALLTIRSYNRLPKDKQEYVINSIDISLLNETLNKEIANENNSNKLVELYSQIIRAQLPGINIEDCKVLIEDKLKENPKESLKRFNERSFSDTDFFDITIIEMLIAAKKDGVDISKYKTNFNLSEKDIEELLKKINAEDIPDEIEITLKIKDFSEFSKEKLEKVSENITEVHLGDDVYTELSYEETEACRGVIDELLKDVNCEDENTPNRERKIFEQIIQKLGKKIEYNYKALKKGRKLVKLNDKLLKSKRLYDEKYAKRDGKIATLRAELDELHVRDAYGGLMYGKAVCVGYAEVVKNVFACIGIEARVIGGFEKDPQKRGHAWNQIKIDGKWYNLDLTWDRELLLKRGCPARWLLKSDKEFKDHAIYIREEGQIEEKCDTSVKSEEVRKNVIQGFKRIKGIFKKPNKVKNWLKNSLRTVSLKDADKILNKLEQHMSQGKETEQ